VKVCLNCEQEKPISDFSSPGSKHCRSCKSRAKRNKLREWIEEYKATLSCEHCGENHPATLDFHHRDPSIKEFGIQEAVSMRYSIERVQKEIEKCAVLCACCHRILHYDLRNNKTK